MTRSSRAMISWLPSDKGGRQQPPTGPRYVTVVRFEDDPQWSQGMWSLVVEFDRVFAGGRYALATIRFAMDEAPHQLLQEGNRFELLEGPRRVAKGVVLPERVDVPSELNSFETALIG